MTESPAQKAVRIVTEGRAILIDLIDSRRVFNIAGDTGYYRVILDRHGAFCTCRANDDKCSHILAAQHQASREDLPSIPHCSGCTHENR